MRVTVFCILLSTVAISADLQSDLDDIYNHLPIEDLVQIAQKYVASYPGLREGLAAVDSLPYDQLFNNCAKANEVHELIAYLNRRGIDADSLARREFQMFKAFIRKVLDQQSSGQSKSSKPVITGNFLADINAVISSVDMLSLVMKKLETIPDYANYVATLQDPEFRTVLYRALHSKALFGKCIESEEPEVRGWFSNAWKKIKNVNWKVTFGK